MILVDTLSCGHFIVFLSFSGSSWTCCHVDILWFFCYFKILRGHTVLWTLRCFSFIFIFLVDILSREYFIVFYYFIFLVDMMSCRHFIISVILMFLVDMMSCRHFILSVILMFLVDALSCGHLFCQFNIPRGHVAIWTLYCFVLF
jgi:hypothetical protein